MSLVSRGVTMSLFHRNAALLATLGIALVVLFPAVRGPFSATYGPASALRAIAYAAMVIFSLSALVALMTQRPASRVHAGYPQTHAATSPSNGPLALRC